MSLRFVTLQILEDLLFGFTGTPTEDATAGVLGAIGFLFWIFIVIGGFVGGTYIFRIIWMKFQYDVKDGGLELFPIRIIWMGKFGSIEGNLSANNSFDEETMIGLEEHTGLKFDKEIVKEQIRNKKLFVYNLKITDEGDILEDFSKKVRLISPVDLADPKYNWLDTKGKRNLGSIIRREKRRNVVLYSTTQRYSVFDEDKNYEQVEYWTISPLPMVDAKTPVQFIGNPIKPVPTHFIDIIKFEGGKQLSQFLEIKPALTEALEKLGQARAEAKNYERLYSKEVNTNQTINMEKEDLKHELAQKKYIEGGEPVIEVKPSMNIAWILGSALMVFFLVVMLPEYLTSMQLIMAQFLGFGIGTMIIVLLYAYTASKQKDDVQKKVESKV